MLRKIFLLDHMVEMPYMDRIRAVQISLHAPYLSTQYVRFTTSAKSIAED